MRANRMKSRRQKQGPNTNRKARRNKESRAWTRHKAVPSGPPTATQRHYETARQPLRQVYSWNSLRIQPPCTPTSTHRNTRLHQATPVFLQSLANHRRLANGQEKVKKPQGSHPNEPRPSRNPQPQVNKTRKKSTQPGVPLLLSGLKARN